jgi:2,3-bisphosphoglycerate-independent phosphoglycerate mutase
MAASAHQRPRPFVLIVMDGWGFNPRREGNAIALARTPHIDQIAATWPHALLQASGGAVGLPAGQMGNSEVGHLNIGAGKKVVQDFTRITAAIEDGSFFQNPALLDAIAHVKRNQSALHLCGLLGTGGVHAFQGHLEACLRLAAQHDIERVFIHSFTDGRDTAPKSGVGFMKDLLSAAQAINPDHPARIATISGRLYAMDRDNRWERTGRVYQAMTRGEGTPAHDPVAAIAAAYDAGVTDEFIEPIVLRDANGAPVALVQAGDAVIYYNFRADRARQLTKAFVLPEMPPPAQGVFDRGPQIPDLTFVTMTEYEKGLPVAVAFAGDDVEYPLARVISEQGMRQFHTAETEKYAHVTYFINGGREVPFPGEERLLVPSPKVKTYDLQPEMSAATLTDGAVERIRAGDFDVLIMNYANADMVGHTGVLEAAIQAVETVDAGVGRVIEATLAVGGAAFITADHGNADMMIDYTTGQPFTAHTTNPVPFYFVVPQWPGVSLRANGILADIAPTALQVLGLPIPADMTGHTLIEGAEQ